MQRGIYTLASGVLTQSRVLNTVSNNMGNAATPGFKKDTVTSTTFREQMIYRMENDRRHDNQAVGKSAPIRTVDGTVTDYTQGSFTQTNRSLDLALDGDGFFSIETNDGPVYTRKASLTIDSEGYLFAQDAGRVRGVTGPIKVDSDKITVDQSGNIFSNNGLLLGKLELVQFEDNSKLVKVDEGFFKLGEDANLKAVTGLTVNQGVLEDSNVNMMNEMIDMMTAQRALQSSSQLIKMYDQLMGRAVNEIGKRN